MIKFTPQASQSIYTDIHNMELFTWYKGERDSYWYLYGDLLMRLQYDTISISPQNEWDQDFKLEKLPKGQLDITLYT